MSYAPPFGTKNNTGITVDTLIREINRLGKTPSCIGIDLTGSERRASGMCILKGQNARLSLARSDEEIIRIIDSAGTGLVSIDSSLGLPAGRCCVNDSCECRKHGIMRESERILRKRGIRIYPTLIKSMQQLTMRGIRLAGVLRDNGYEIIESYPGGTQDILNIPRKKTEPVHLMSGLSDMRITMYADRERIVHDELDALTSALVGYFYLSGWYEAVGNSTEGFLILPDLSAVDKEKGSLLEH
jgi:predicted nuclease with RNAse H fold